MMFHPERATRLQQQAYLDGRQWSLAATIDQLTTTFFMDNSKKGYAAGLQEVVQANLIEHLMQLGQMVEVPSSVRATVFDKLSNLKTSLSKNKQLAQAPYFAQRINQYLSNYELQESLEVPKIPDGSPIGSIACDFETVWK
jgi:non-homologous end joining protein Ku